MRAALVLILSLLSAPMAAAQPQQGAGPLPQEMLAPNASRAENEQLWSEVQAAARRADVAEAALATVVRRMVDLQFSTTRRLELQSILDSLDGAAVRLRELETRVALLEGGDAESQRLRQEAEAALQGGRLDNAEALLLSLAQRHLARAMAERRNAAETFATLAAAAELRFGYSRSAGHWESAAQATPDELLRWRYRLNQAAALSRPDSPCDDDGCRWEIDATGAESISLGPGDDMLRQSIAVLEREALPLAPRERRLDQWVETQIVLARRYAALCRRSVTGARKPQDCTQSLEAFAAVLGALPVGDPRARAEVWRFINVVAELPAPEDGAMQARADAALQVIIANVTFSPWLVSRAHFARGRIALFSGAEDALQLAIGHYRLGAAAARTMDGDDADSARWDAGGALNSLGRHIMGVANERHDAALWREAVALFEQSLAMDLPRGEIVRADASYQLATALLFLDDLGEPLPFERARDLLFEALEVHTREHDAERWAVLQNNLGRCFEKRADRLRALGEQGDVAAFQDSIDLYARAGERYELALDVWTFEHANFNVAANNLNRVRSRNVFAPPRALEAPRAGEEAPERAGRPD